MSQELEFRILGPLEASREGNVVDLGARQQRALLAMLLLHANEVVSRDRLIDAIWGEAPPDRARNMIQVYVSRLRRALGPRSPARMPRRPASCSRTRSACGGGNR